jgi:hypothetical protein
LEGGVVADLLRLDNASELVMGWIYGDEDDVAGMYEFMGVSTWGGSKLI